MMGAEKGFSAQQVCGLGMPTAQILIGNELFVHNMRALWRADVELALRVDAVMDDDRLPLEATRSGHWTTKMAGPDGAEIYLHSRVDPVAEARRLIESVPMEEKFCFVVSGFGLGYHIRELFDRLRGDAFVVCSEPSIRLIATALTCVDLADVISSGKLIILTDADKAGLHTRLRERSTLVMLGSQFVRHQPSARIAGEFHSSIHQLINEFVSFTRMSLLTLVSNSQITCRNIAMNLVNYVTTPPIDMLRDRFVGNPGIIVSAGPSLSRNLDELAAVKGRAVICAVQTAIRPLMQRGIVPDFVTCLDFHEMSRKFFENVGDLSDVHLVAEPKATWHVLDHYPGPISILDNSWARLLIGDELAGRDGLTAGATVAHLAFYLAVYMGCDPIIFVGQDLAFTGHVFYVPGVEVHHAWRSELNQFSSIEHKEWERIARNRPILRKVTGIDGGELYTDDLLFTYLEQFEKDIAGVPRRVINASQGGARIRGTQTMKLGEAIEQFCREPVPEERFAYRKSTRWHDLGKLAATRVELERRVAEMDDVVRVCDELLVLFKELQDLTHDPEKFNRRLIRVDELRTKVHQESRPYRIINAATQLAELRRYSADRHIDAATLKDADRAKRQLTRDIDFITGVRDGVGEVKPMLEESLKRIVLALAK